MGRRAADDSQSATAYFSVAQVDGHWWFVAPGGRSFYSLGLNHIDSSVLRARDTLGLWRDTYGGDQSRWIRESVTPSLRRFGFNTIGWVQEVVVRGDAMRRHSRSWIAEEYRVAEMPYCHMLPFADVHQWEVETRHPDVFSDSFAQWSDYVARSECVDLVDDPNLVGYFYSDCPNWIHPTLNSEMKGPWFDPEDLNSEKGRRTFAAMVEKYYQVTHDAVRRYDPNHLILGDRLEGRRPLPDDVVRIASRYVDVLSFQYFGDPEENIPDLARWHEMSGLPILLADASVTGRTVPDLATFRRNGNSYEGQGERYAEMLEAYFTATFMIGWHYCGAFIENDVRMFGLLDRFESPNLDLVEAMAEKNREVLARVPNSSYRRVRDHA